MMRRRSDDDRVPDQAAPLWIAAGWTIFHFLWIGAAIGLIAPSAGGDCSDRHDRRHAMHSP